MSYWLVKSEPTTYSWSDFVRDGRTSWDGVRNYQARNNLASMRNGDQVLFYHSIGDKEVVGIARVVREGYPDPKADEEGWIAVDLEPVETLKRGVTLAEIKGNPALRAMALVKQGRLSVSPVTEKEFRTIVAMGATASPAKKTKPAVTTKKPRSKPKSAARSKAKTAAGKKRAKARRK